MSCKLVSQKSDRVPSCFDQARLKSISALPRVDLVLLKRSTGDESSSVVQSSAGSVLGGLENPFPEERRKIAKGFLGDDSSISAVGHGERIPVGRSQNMNHLKGGDINP